MINYDRAERSQDAVDTDRSLTELNKILRSLILALPDVCLILTQGHQLTLQFIRGGRIQQEWLFRC